MDRDEAVERLPLTYQRIIAWLDEGEHADEIAGRLGIDPGAVPALIELATAKLERAAEEMQSADAETERTRHAQ